MKNSPVHIVAVEYLNTLPFIRGLEALEDDRWFHLIRAHPSECANIFKEGKADIGLIPVGAVPEMGPLELFSSWCIGAEGTVDTVGIVSDHPIGELDKILLDYQSRTSVALCRILVRQYRGLDSIELVDAYPGYERDITGGTGGLVIGDRVFELRREKPCFYDLGDAWMQWTKLPFAFALWLSRPGIEESVKIRLNRAFEQGMDQIPFLSGALNGIVPEDYFKDSISYRFDDEKKRAVTLFLQKCGYTETARQLFPVLFREMKKSITD